MSSESRTFSESWYRIANREVCLRAQVEVRRQYFRGEKWYVLYDPFNNQFFRLRPAAYDFVAHLRPGKTVQEVWDECLDRNPDDAPGQEDVIQLLAQLFHANLLHFNLPADSAKMFERYRKRKQKEIRSKILGIMFARFPLLDPDQFLKRTLPLVRPFLGIFGAIIWITVVLGAGKVVIDRFDLIKEQTQGILAPNNIALLYVALVLIKTLHEFGHAFVCRHFGGEVHEMGVMLLVFTPIPYMDATSAWAFRSRWQRIYVAAAGMLVEVFVAACAAFVWAYTGTGNLHALAYNLIFIASVSTIIFNINPLLRFDGYYILSDLLDIPNLHTRSRQQLVHLVEHYAYGCKKSYSPANSRVEGFWLTFFGIASGIYRIVVFTGIIIFIADKFLLAGLLMAAFCCFSWGVVPIFRLIKYLGTSPRLERTRQRAIWVTCGTVLAVFCLVDQIPFPNRFRSPGIVETEIRPYVVNRTEGYVEEVFVTTGTTVVPGQKLIRLSNRELELELEKLQAERRESELLLRRSLNAEAADTEAILSRIRAIDKKIEHTRERIDGLVVKAGQQGSLSAPNIDQLTGMWMPRGTVVGQILNRDLFRFSAIVSQDEASRLFDDQDAIREVEIRLAGQPHRAISIPPEELRKIEAEQEVLPSAAMGWGAGGDVEIDTTDPSGRRAAESFFAVLAPLPHLDDLVLSHGLSGKIRYELAPQPLLRQWLRKLRQLLQQRYGI